jgi:pilus assembly protein CpaB
MNVKKFGPLILALGLGLVTLYMTMRFVNSQQAANAQTKRPQVVMAKDNIEAGGILTEDNLTKGELSTDIVPDTVFTDPGELLGRVASVPIVDGQVITKTLLAPKGVGAGLQAVVPMGMRAVTLEINEISGVAGNVLPGCHVDILQTLRDETTGLSMARTIAQNVLVTAVGMRHNPNDGSDGGGHSVTVLVTPVQAEMLELASATGRPRLVLRGGNDLALVDTPDMTINDLLGHQSGRKDNYNTVDPGVAASAAGSTGAPGLTPLASANAAAAAQAAADSSWTMQVVRGSNEQQVKFEIRKPEAQPIAPQAQPLNDTGAQ